MCDPLQIDSEISIFNARLDFQLSFFQVISSLPQPPSSIAADTPTMNPTHVTSTHSSSVELEGVLAGALQLLSQLCRRQI